MTKEQIKETDIFKFVEKLKPSTRYDCLLGNSKMECEYYWKVRIEQWPTASLGQVNDDWIALSVYNRFDDNYYLAVIIPNTPQCPF